jgi:acyl-CoA synthetase (AMP-forming)/AMP-acid ligase II
VLAPRPEGSDLEVGAGVRRALAALVPAYMLPRRIRPLEQFPLTPNGKTDRRALAAMIGT